MVLSVRMGSMAAVVFNRPFESCKKGNPGCERACSLFIASSFVCE